MARTADSSLQTGLMRWDTARRQVQEGERRRAALTYHVGVQDVLLSVTLSRTAQASGSGLPGSSDLVALYHALAAMTREGVPLMEQINATKPARRNARTGLAAAHLADPAQGRPEQVAGALAADAESPPVLDLNGDGPLSDEVLIAAAAEARLILATLLADRPDLRLPHRRPWSITTEPARHFAWERRRFRYAMLPSCAGLSPVDEMRQLAQESLLLYTELWRANSRHEPARDRARDLAARIRN
ncbi:hypothetical protein E0H73_16085 [Kribbella pittospori]|uniref:Uncharacterized protein n=1 Tax=Kribbella pittospori TaxID=722689 RepID=A0A4R0KN56_9ACTN|nr:hypothetical protein [Kribbella pittospori]TCC62223.1 hypothetical protein E0H73_16085 [Kribbella pittospori]